MGARRVRRPLVQATVLPLALALAGGALWGLCFGRHPMVLLPWVALVPLLLFLDHPRAGGLAFVHGLGTWLVSIPWLKATLEIYGELAPWLASLVLLLLAVYLALFHWAFARLGVGLWRLGGGVALWSLPALWVALEWLRTHFLSGFPWNLAAYAWVDVAGALPLAAWLGGFGISLLLVLANTGVALAVRHRGWQYLALGWLVPLLALPLAGRWAGPSTSAGGGKAVRILQPNTPILVDREAALIQHHYRKLFDLSQESCDASGALLVWPESAAWPYVLDRDPAYARDIARLTARGCSLLVNSPRFGEEGVFNAAFLVGRQGAAGRYDKRHLVPFGEYVPLARLLPFVGTLARNAGDFSPGAGVQLIDWGEERLGVSICFEVIFPEEVAALARSGASILVTMTNDAWYGDTAAPWQHFRAARFRAAENGRPLLRAALTGVSGWIDPRGRVRQALGVGEEGVIRARVRGHRELTPYTRRPWLVPLACSLVAAFAIFWAYRR